MPPFDTCWFYPHPQSSYCRHCSSRMIDCVQMKRPWAIRINTFRKPSKKRWQSKRQTNMYLFAYFLRRAVNQLGQNDVITITLSHCWAWTLVGDLPVNGDSPHKGPVLCSFGKFFAVGLTKQLNKQSSFRWFKMQYRPCGINVMGTTSCS